MNMRMDIGKRLSEVRKAKGLNQKDFGALGGIKIGAQGLYETGKSAPTAEYLANLHRHGIDIGYILTGIRSGQSLNDEYDSIISGLSCLSDRERRAISRLVDDLTGRAPAHGSVAQILEHDGMGHLLDEARGTLHDPAVPFRGKSA